MTINVSNGPDDFPMEDRRVAIGLEMEDARRLSHALADFTMWIEGFCNAGGKYSGDVEALRELNASLKPHL